MRGGEGGRGRGRGWGGRGKGKGGEKGGDVEGPGKWSARGPRWLSAGLMTEVMTNHTTDAIYKKSYDKVMINLRHNLQQSYDHDFVVITLS